MNKYILTGALGLTALLASGHADANTELIINKDTGAQVYLDANENLVGTRNSSPEDNGFKSAEVGVNAEANADVSAKSESDEAEKSAKDKRAEIEAEVNQTQEELDAKAEAAQGDAETRIQDLDDRTEAGVQATATTKIDVR